MAKKARKEKKGYFHMGRVVSIILAIIPITSWILGIITKFVQGGVWKIICGILRIIFGWNILWILDLIWMILFGTIFPFI